MYAVALCGVSVNLHVNHSNHRECSQLDYSYSRISFSCSARGRGFHVELALAVPRARRRARRRVHSSRTPLLPQLCFRGTRIRLNVLPMVTTVLGYSTCVNPPTADTHAQCIRAPRLRRRAQPTAAATQRCCCLVARIQRRTYPRIADPLALCNRLLRIQRDCRVRELRVMPTGLHVMM